MHVLTQRLVDEACDRGVNNGYGYFMKYAPSWVVAKDLIKCDVDFEDHTQEELVPLVDDWQRRHNA